MNPDQIDTGLPVLAEASIDPIVYRLFDLTPDQIALIESALAPTRSAPKRQRKGQ